jgi:DNA-binding MarR family transcriptional regulator
LPPPGPRNPRSRAADELARAAPLVSRWIERLLAGHRPPLTVAQFLALQSAAGGEVAGGELARRAAVSPAAASQLLSGLEESGLIRRERGLDDRRRQEIELTPAGRATLRSARLALRRGLASVLDDLLPHEADVLADGLVRLEAILSGAPPPRRPPRPPHPPPGPPHPPRSRPRGGG